ncbi:MAG: carbohydrate-binding protein [Lysobacterales bacterium]
MSGVQTGGTGDEGGGRVVGYIDAGDWMSYYNTPVTIPVSGTYEISYRVSSGANGGSFKLEEAGGSPVYGSISFPATGSWETFTTISHRVQLPAGTRRLAIAATSGGWNINWFRITRVN